MVIFLFGSAIAGYLFSLMPGVSPNLREDLLFPMRALLWAFGIVVLLVVFVLGLGVVMKYSDRKTGKTPPSTDPDEFRKWLQGKIPILRSVGFFAKESQLSDDELADRIMSEFTNPADIDMDSCMNHPELVTLRDADRVYFTDYETDDVLSEEGYQCLFSRFSHISRGRFNPESVRAFIDEESKETKLSFEQEGKNFEFGLKYDGDWMDPTLIEKLNSTFAHTGFRFAIVGPGDGLFVVVVNEEERKILRNKAGWDI